MLRWWVAKASNMTEGQTWGSAGDQPYFTYPTKYQSVKIGMRGYGNALRPSHAAGGILLKGYKIGREYLSRHVDIKWRDNSGEGELMRNFPGSGGTDKVHLSWLSYVVAKTV
jgi:hypothetical protein